MGNSFLCDGGGGGGGRRCCTGVGHNNPWYISTYKQVNYKPELRHTPEEIEAVLPDYDGVVLDNDYWETWLDWYLDLQVFHKIHQHCNVTGKYKDSPGFGQWVKNQRKLYKMRKLHPARIMLLNQLNFRWSKATLTPTLTPTRTNNESVWKNTKQKTTGGTTIDITTTSDEGTTETVDVTTTVVSIPTMLLLLPLPPPILSIS